eukprot:CAMPEP_0179017956 /NCGR_PEP_ID=MMETSP0796-20121207/4105_1 /TAXON_ID=73915 /ORGANISM="Pyrodinium bahamense, Strain pbaha01" /LENGTH=250 /DNA_ID=CAMNT_0020713699 /DNA_START=6 /DNA_END=754 /DNA_ORIENTATION=-
MRAQLQRQLQSQTETLCDGISKAEISGIDLSGSLLPLRGVASAWESLGKAAKQRQLELGGEAFLEVRLDDNRLRVGDEDGVCALLSVVHARFWRLGRNLFGRLGVARILSQLVEQPSHGPSASIHAISLDYTGADPRAFPLVASGGAGLKNLQSLDLSGCPALLEAEGLAALSAWTLGFPALREIRFRNGGGPAGDGCHSEDEAEADFGPGALPHLQQLLERGVALATGLLRAGGRSKAHPDDPGALWKG